MDKPKGRILIVDDESELRGMYSKFLTREGFEVDEAVDGQQGLEKLTKGNYDACIVDGEMPGMNGIPLLREIEHNSIYKIFNSGDSTLVKQAEKENLADAYFTKPASILNILSHVNYAVTLTEMELVAEDYGY